MTCLTNVSGLQPSGNKKEHMEQARLVRCDKVYVVDGMAREAEHEVIRLPPTIAISTPSNWCGAMKRYVAYNCR